jgi:hypothetical protein
MGEKLWVLVFRRFNSIHRFYWPGSLNPTVLPDVSRVVKAEYFQFVLVEIKKQVFFDNFFVFHLQSDIL